MAESVEQTIEPQGRGDRIYRLLQAALLTLRAGPALILFVLIVFVSLTTPVFFTSRNLGNVLSQTAVIAVLALGQLLVIVSRGIDLSVGSTVALSGVVGAIVYLHVHSTALVVLAILGTGLAVGLANGIVFVVGRVPHPFIVTLASLSIVRGLALWAAHGTLIAGMPGGVDTLGGGSIGWLPYSAFVVLGLALLAVVGTTYLVWGRWLYAVGGNPDGARRAGMPVGRVLISVDFPAPLSPSSASTSPPRTSTSTSSRPTTAPKRLLAPRTARTVIPTSARARAARVPRCNHAARRPPPRRARSRRSPSAGRRR